MFWVFYALIGPVLWAIVGIINKIIRTKYLNCTASYTILIGLINIFVLFIIPIYGISLPILTVTIICLIAGVMQAIAAGLYIKTLCLEEISRIMPLFRFVAVFVLILATIFLGETLTFNSYIAFFMLILGGFLISVKKIEGMFRLSKAFFIIMVSSLFFATGGILLKYASNFTSFTTFFILSRIGFLIAALFLLLFNFHKFKSAIFALNKASFTIIIVTETIALIGVLSSYYAISIAPISLVNAVESFHPLFVFVFASLISFKLPNLLKEELTWKVLLTKSTSIVIMIGGLLLIYLK